MAKVDTEKLEARYLKARDKWRAHQKSEREKRKKKKAREDTERKIIAGEFVLSLVEKGDFNRQRFMTLLDDYLSDDRQRQLFDLKPIAEKTAIESQTNKKQTADAKQKRGSRASSHRPSTKQEQQDKSDSQTSPIDESSSES